MSPPKTNMEPENGPRSKRRFRLWKRSFSGSILKFGGVFQIQKKVDLPAIATLVLHPRNLTWIPTNCGVSNKITFSKAHHCVYPAVGSRNCRSCGGHFDIIAGPPTPRQPSSRHHRCLEVIVTILSSNFHIDPYMDVSENRVFSPQIIHFNRVFHYFHHPCLGVFPYFWKHPYIYIIPLSNK